MGSYNKPDKKLCVRVMPMKNPTKCPPLDLDEVINVNDDMNPVLINNEHFTGHIVFRVKDFEGWTPLNSKSDTLKTPIKDCPGYFKNHRRTFSMQISGRWRKQWTGDDIMFGTFFDKPLHLPMGTSIALSVAKRIDPSMEYDLYGKSPYICSPILCAMNTAHMQPLLANTSPSMRGSALYETAFVSKFDNIENGPLTLPEWKYYGEKGILDENLMSAWPTWYNAPSSSFYVEGGRSVAPEPPSNPSKSNATHRRSWFLNKAHRKRFIFHPDTVYSWDFASHYVDMNTLKLKLGISINAGKYLGDQPVRYECRSRNGDILFWAVEIALR